MANINGTGSTAYSTRQRAASLTLGVACSIPLTSTMALAHAPMPAPAMAFGGHTNFASPVHHTSTSFVNGHPASLLAPVATGGTLNLASPGLSYLAGNLANFSSLTIDVGGHARQVNLNTKLTAAEVVAVEQVITGGAGAQTIKIGASGAATGGTVGLTSSLLTALDNSVGGSIGALTVARGVQVIDSVSNLSVGSLSNFGSIVTAAGTSGKTDTISANTIVNGSTGSIGSYAGGGGLVAADPSLSAQTSLTNNGSISSAGNLTISAPTVNNAPSNGSPATISAAQSVNISTQNLNNSGNIAAALGNVNIASTAGLNINGAGGTMQANNGNINVSSTNADIADFGGNMLSQQVNFDSGTGNIVAQVGQVTGVVNANGGNVHIGADTTSLDMGAINATADPIITSTGDLHIAGATVSAGNPVTVIASGNIVSDIGNTGINTAGTGLNQSGGAITLIAGAAFTPFSNGTGVATTVTKASTTGGLIDLTGGNNGALGAPVTALTSAATNGKGNGGAIQLIAFAGKNAGTGSVLTPGGITITATGLGGGTDGNVNIIAGAKSGLAVSTGGIAAGVVNVDTSTPVLIPAKSTTGVSFDTSGNQTTGTFGPSKTGNVASISLGNVAASGNLNILSGSGANVVNTSTGLNLGTVVLGKTSLLAVSDSSAGNINVGGIITGGTTTITETGTGLTTVSGTGSINTTSLSFTTSNAAGNNQLNTNVTNLSFVSNKGSSVTDTQGTAALNLSGSILAAPGTLSVTSNGQINVTSLLKVVDSSITLTTLATDKGGILIEGPIQVGTGAIDLNLAGKGLLTQKAGNPLTGNVVNIISVTGFGTKAVPLQTNANTLDVEDKGTKNIVYIADLNNGPLTFQDLNATAGGSLFLTSVSSALSVNSANYNNVSITNNTVGSAGVDFSSSKSGPLGTGLGTFTVTAAGAITDSGLATINGTIVTLTGTTGVGTNKLPMLLNSPTLALNSSNGNVIASDILAATVNGAASLSKTFSVTDSGAGAAKTNASLTVGKSVGGGTIDLTTTGSGQLVITGTVGTSNTGTVALLSAKGLTTKGAINGQTIGLEADGGTLVVGGVVGSLISNITVQTKGVAGDTITVGGVLTGNVITVNSIGLVTTTKAITGTGSGSTVLIEGSSSAANVNAVTIGGAVTGLDITIQLNTTPLGSIAVNAAVGNVTTAQTTIDATGGAKAGQTITGKGVIGGQSVELDATGAIGTAKASIPTTAVNLSVNVGGANVGGTFIAQKGNLTIDKVQTDNLVMKVTGTTDVVGPITTPALNLVSTSATVIGGNITISAGGTTPNILTSGGAFTTNAASVIDATASAQPLTINVTGAGTVNGTVKATTLNLNTTTAFTIGTGGVVGDAAADTYNVTTKGPMIIGGTLGGAAGLDILKVSSTAAVTIGFPTGGTVNGAVGSTLTGLTISNAGTVNGSLTLSATGSGTAFTNLNGGVIGGGGDSVTVNALKGSIVSAPGSDFNATSLAVTAGGSASINMAPGAAATITGATVTGAFTVTDTKSNLFVGGNIKAGSVNITYAGLAGNANAVQLNNITTTNGDLLVSSNAQSLGVASASAINTTNGNITLQNTSTSATPSIGILNTSVFHASGAKTNLNQGNVYIVIGALPPAFTPSKGTVPVGNPVINPTLGGLVTFGAAGSNTLGTITAQASDTLNATGRNIVFNQTSAVGASITLGANVTITADPPAGAPASLASLVSSVNTLSVPAPSLNASSNALSIPVSSTTSGGSATSSGLSYASINNANVTTMTVGNPGLTAGLLGSIGNISTAENTIDNAFGNVGSTGSSATIGSNATTGTTNLAANLHKLTGAVSNTARRTLDRGPLLLVPEQNTVVDTPFGAVNVAANSVALIISSERGLAVYNLHDAHKNSVVIGVGSSAVSIAPGRNALLTRSSVGSFEEVNPVPFIGYRQVASQAASNEMKIYQSEFDLLSMVRGLPAMKEMLTSDSAKTRKTMGNMLKTAAILMQISQSGERYSLYLAPKVTAFLSSAQR